MRRGLHFSEERERFRQRWHHDKVVVDEAFIDLVVQYEQVHEGDLQVGDDGYVESESKVAHYR